MDKDKLSDNWRFKENNRPVDENTLADYIAKHGVERALGYLDAIADVQADIYWIQTHNFPGAGGWGRTDSKVAKLLRDFTDHKEKFIKHVLNHPIVERDNTLNQKLKQS